MKKACAAVQLPRVCDAALLVLFAASLVIIANAAAQSAGGSWTLQAPHGRSK